MEEKMKKLNLIFSILGVAAGIISFYIANLYLIFLVVLVIYFVSFFVIKLLGMVQKVKQFIIETLLPFFGFWLLIWILLFNIL